MVFAIVVSAMVSNLRILPSKASFKAPRSPIATPLSSATFDDSGSTAPTYFGCAGSVITGPCWHRILLLYGLFLIVLGLSSTSGRASSSCTNLYHISAP
eukprot:COSAG02_NODE_5401_length_4361_cov_3.564054_5_plen_99_part_00